MGKSIYKKLLMFTERFNQQCGVYIKHPISKKEKKELYFKCIVDKVIWGSSEVDFFELCLYKKTISQILEYSLSRWDMVFADTIDDLSKRIIWYDKRKMYGQIKPFIGREQLFSEEMSFEEYQNFVRKHQRFFVKPTRDECGNGVQVVEADFENLKNQYDNLVSEKYVLDELIEQNEYMKKICPKSVNTIRVFTIRFKDKIEFVGSALRFGMGNSVVDNYSAGGGVYAL